MNDVSYKTYVESELKNYTYWKKAITTLEEELKSFNYSSITGIDYSSERIQTSNMNSEEDRIISQIYDKKKKEDWLRGVRPRVKFIEQSLKIMREEEVEILKEVYMTGKYVAPRDLEGKLHLSKSQIYKILNRALSNYAKARIGYQDL